MNPKNLLSNNFVRESLGRQEKILEKTSQIKALVLYSRANLLQAKEKKGMRTAGAKLAPLASRDCERTTEKSVKAECLSSDFRQIERNVRVGNNGVGTERSKTLNEGFNEIESGLVDEEEKEKEENVSTVKVNPNIDLSLLFFDEMTPDWAE